MQLPATQTISTSAIDANFNIIVGINTSSIGSMRFCVPKTALEISELALPASDWLPRLDNKSQV
jgi:hypothetical protein